MRVCVCVYVTGKADRGPRLLVTTLHLFRWPIDILGRVGAQEPITDNVRINLKEKNPGLMIFIDSLLTGLGQEEEEDGVVRENLSLQT